MTIMAKKSRLFQSIPMSHNRSTDRLTENFEKAVLENWSRICAVLSRLTGDGDEAEDLAIETFMRLYRQPWLDHHQEDHQMGGWLYRVATNLGLNALRSGKRRQYYEQTSGQAWLAEPRIDNPAEIFSAEENRQNVRTILSSMPAKQAQILILNHSGFSYQEIASIVQVSASSIGSLLYRAEVEFEKRYRAAYLAGENG